MKMSFLALAVSSQIKQYTTATKVAVRADRSMCSLHRVDITIRVEAGAWLSAVSL
jgi:hypothetical protein